MDFRASVLGLLTAEKSFAHRWVGDRRLNQLGLHLSRIALARLAARSRRLFTKLPVELAAPLARDGIAIVNEFVDPSSFEALRAELDAAERIAAIEAPIASSGDRGFGPRRPFEGGFDRYDGATLNRFLVLDGAVSRRVGAKVAAIGAAAAGARPRPERVELQLLVHGDGEANRDPQTSFHRDTFHAAFKAWLFLDEVAVENGPLCYVPGSHAPTPARLRWEHGQAIDAASRASGGAFRIDAADLSRAGFGEPRLYPVPANTLIVADVGGFHRRAVGAVGASRRALHGSFRPSPFVPVPY